MFSFFILSKRAINLQNFNLLQENLFILTIKKGFDFLY